MKTLDNLTNLSIALIATLVAYLSDLEVGQIFGIFLISYPWKFGKNIWSLFGGKNNEGSVSSLFGIYQDAKNDAYQIVSINIFQKAGNDAVQFFGISLFQKAGNDAVQTFGISLFQNKG